MKRIFLPFLILTVSFFVTCQETQVKVNGNISGTVKDKQTSLTIDHCAVSIIPGNKQVYTSASGEFEFTDIIMGEYTVSFSKAGYNSYSRQITVEPDKTVKADVMLEPATAPVVNTVTADDIQYTQATIHGMIAQKGESTLKECGFYYGTSASMDRKYICRGTDTEFSATLQDLFDGTLYYYQAYAVNTIGEGKGEIKTFETIALIPAQVQTMNATEITTSQATLNGYITSKGNSDIIECGFYFGATENPEQKYEVEYESDNFSITVTDLTDGATYYYCAYATNAKGEVRGEVVGFNAQTALVPTVKTGEATGVELYQSVINGEIISDGGAVVTECGFYFGNAANPTQKYPVANNENGLMSRIMTSLSEGTTYYYIAYAINSKGESKGEERTFTTVPITVPEVSTHEVTDVTETTAKVSGRLNSTGRSSNLTVGFVYDTTEKPVLDRCLGFSSDTASINKVFETRLTSLTKGTTYYVRSYATNEKGTTYGDDVQFITDGPTLADVETKPATDISVNSAVFNGNIKSLGQKVNTLSDHGFVYGTAPEPTFENGDKLSLGSISNKGNYSKKTTELLDGTKYYVRAYAINEKGTAFGDIVEFTTTEMFIPVVKLSQVYNVSYTSVYLSGQISSLGNAPIITDCGFVLDTIPSPTVESGIKESYGEAKSAVSFTGRQVGNLMEGTTYYVRAYATNAKGTGYSTEAKFTTKAIFVPTVELTSVSDVTLTSATFNGNIKSAGNATKITDYGFVYSQTPNPTTETGTKVSKGERTSTGTYNSKISNLTEGTKYYVRAYATNEKGTGYSEDYEFTTTAIVVPDVEVYTVTSIGTTTSSFIGRVNSFGNASKISDYGFVWSTEPEPTLEEGKMYYSMGMATKLDNIYYYYDGASAGKYRYDVTGLTDGTTYYVRAYATNEKGTSYSEDFEFKTTAIVVPKVEVYDVTETGTTKSSFIGLVKSFGNAANISDYGFVWSTSPNPTLETGTSVGNGFVTKIDNIYYYYDGSSAGKYRNNVTGLQDGTTYYVRAYATNEKGTGYSEDFEFKTVEIVVPKLEVYDVTNISTTTSTYIGRINSFGNSDGITDYGFVWSTTPEPTLSDSTKSYSYGKATKIDNIYYYYDGSSAGKFALNVSSLTDGTTYYVRAYATNNKGTGYSADYEFTTQKIVPPTVDITNVLITSNSARCYGTIKSFGRATIVKDYGFVWDTHPNPTLETGSKVSLGSTKSTVDYYTDITGLEKGTKYYVRAYATNEKGTGYSDDEFEFTF